MDLCDEVTERHFLLRFDCLVVGAISNGSEAEACERLALYSPHGVI